MKKINEKPKLSRQDVQHVAHLAKLSLSPEELGKYQKQLNEVLDYVEILRRLDTKNLEPTSQVTGLENIFSQDKAVESLSVQDTLSAAKEKQDNFFKTKPIFEK